MDGNKNRKETKEKALSETLLICLVLGAVSVGCVIGIVSAEDTTNKKFLFDESHHQSWYNYIDAGLADFAKELRNKGYQVDRVTDGPITYDKLKDYDIFVLPNGLVGKHSFDEGVKLLTDDEIKALKKFVADGGGLFLFGSGWSWVDYTHLSIEKAQVNRIGKEFGIKLNDDIVYDPTNRYPGCREGEGCPIFHRPFIKEHPITKDVYEITNCKGFPSSLTISDPSVDVVISGDEDSYTGYRGEYYKKGENPPFIAVTEYVKGKVVFAGSVGFLLSIDENNDGIKNLYEYDNKKLGLNIIDWLSVSLAKEIASKLINSVSTKIDALKRKNVDTSLIEQALSKAEDSYELEKYDEAYELAQNAQKMADDAYETAGYIESAQSEIDEAKSIGADVTDAESKLKDATDALNKGNYEYARSWADDALELAKHASVGSVKIIDLKALATKYDQRTVVVSGTIRDIETVYGKGYTFALDDGTGMISVVYEGGLGDIQEGDKVTVSGAFQASTGTVAAETVQKSGVGGVPGFEAIFAIAGLLTVAYLIRRRKEG